MTRSSIGDEQRVSQHFPPAEHCARESNVLSTADCERGAAAVVSSDASIGV